jgi:di/tricarboxylate transporter
VEDKADNGKAFMILTFAILAFTIILFVSGRIRSDLVALISVLALFLAEIISLDQALSGFSDSTVLMIAALFVVGEGLSRTGVTAWLGEKILDVAGSNKVRLLVVLMVGTAVLSAFISNTGTVATLLPAVVAAAWRIGSVPSKFLIPLAFSANTGGLLTLTGTPPNIVVADTLHNAGFEPFSYFEYALIGLPLLISAVIYMVFIGRKLLPRRKADERPAELVEEVGQLAETFALSEELYRLRVRYSSRLIGQTLEKAGLGHDYNVTVLSVESASMADTPHLGSAERAQRSALDRLERFQERDPTVPGPDTVIDSQDVLLVKGSGEAVYRLMADFNLGVLPVEDDDEALSEVLLSSEIGIAEVLLTPRSVYIGRTVVQGHFAEKFGVQVLSIRRGNQSLGYASQKLAFGDALLVRGTWQDIDRLGSERRNFVVVGSPEAMSRQVVELTPRSVIAVLALLGMIAMMVTGIVPAVVATLIAAVVMVLGGCLTMSQSYRSISWQSVVLIAAMIPMSTALAVTGGAEFLADSLVNSFGSIGPLALMAAVFILTTAFSQVINNTATALLVAPIVLRAAVDLDVSPYPLLMIVAVSASTAFLTPIGTTTNLMVMTPGDYRFNDYMRAGFPLLLIFLLVSLLLIPLIWPF